MLSGNYWKSIGERFYFEVFFFRFQMFYVVFITINLNFNVLRKIFISTIPHTVLGFCSLKAPTNYLLQLTLGHRTIRLVCYIFLYN